ncbi:hypothetical protein AC579_3692 [Pseudocercospora musae]|uniref:Protein kinase domain-containing protein n=1 Tax=Pseudocercospora musae TaxID=113226 RepID=A0A139IIV8_9PEZI|nr:hypothetical protein AC579_3692 [Pseudocercospora musae]
MFSSALKSFSSNISSNYTIAPQPSSTCGPWKIFDAKRKQTGKAVSVFVFDRKSLEPQSGAGFGARSSASSLKRAHEEVVERLRREASSLARLRHPSILELAEPVEETSKGGLMFVAESVVSSLAGLLEEKDQQERSDGRASRYVVEEPDGTRRRRELEIDELEIQKGLLQLAKGLEFLHESAGLVHANLTPDAILVNAKGDWKISGLAFTGPHETSTAATSLHAISLHEVLNHDPRLPRSVQLNIDYTSPDFVLDNSLAASADMFSLGLVIIALYNSPHASPLSTGGSLSSYRRVFSSSSTVPTPSNNFLVPSSHPLPPKLSSELLPRLITRRPAQRLSAKEFQEASYFDNILVSTIRFLDALPAKTPNEKMQFLRGLSKIMPQFPKSVLEKKVLPALLEETKDKELLALIMTNVFAMVKIMPTGKRAFTEKVVPKLREVFIINKAADKDTSKEAALMILLESMQTVTQNCSGKEFRDDILPIVLLALESPTHAIIDAGLSTLPFVLPSLDFSTIKNELFPVIAQVFAKTSSLTIKIRGLEAFYTLCGGNSNGSNSDDDLNGIGVPDKKSNATSSSIILDKYTVQEKVVPLLKGIKTKEPSVMMAALKVFKQVAEVADTDFLAMDVLPILWEMSLGPLLNLAQFQAFMALIKSMSGKIEIEQTRKLQQLSSANGGSTPGSSRIGSSSAGVSMGSGDGDGLDFESLVSGRKPAQNKDLMNDWGAPTSPPSTVNSSVPTSATQPTFSWQSSLRTQAAPARAITPDLAAYSTLTPTSQFSQPLQPGRPFQPVATPALNAGGSIDWSAATGSNSASSWTTQRPLQPQQTQTLKNGMTPALPPRRSFGIPPPPAANNRSPFITPAANQQLANVVASTQKNGLDKYESLL